MKLDHHRLSAHPIAERFRSLQTWIIDVNKFDNFHRKNYLHKLTSRSPLFLVSRMIQQAFTVVAISSRGRSCFDRSSSHYNSIVSWRAPSYPPSTVSKAAFTSHPIRVLYHLSTASLLFPVPIPFSPHPDPAAAAGTMQDHEGGWTGCVVVERCKCVCVSV